MGINPIAQIKTDTVDNFANIYYPGCATWGMSTLHPFRPRNLEPELGNETTLSLASPEMSFGNLEENVTTIDI